jgi:rRNA biogenesis protein RRP5
MSLRQNKPKTTAKAASVSSFSVGQRVTVVVKRVESFGVFLRVQGSSVSGLCHKCEVHDSDTKAWDKDLQVGSERQAVVIEVVPDKQRIAFSLKQSRVGVMSTQVSEQSDEEEDDSMVIRLPDEDEDSASEAGDAAADTAMPLALALDPIPAKPLAVSSTFGNVALAKRQRDEESSDDEDESRAAKVPRATLQAADVTADLQANQPTSAADFERLLLTSPNSSLLWISYMALHVSTSDLAMARKTAKRALATINFRELAEKFNVWVALLNLENQYGTDADFQKVFQDAVKANTPKAIYLKACELLTESGKTTRAQELHEETLKKFPESSKVWTLFAAFLFGTSKAEDARALLPRSLKALPKRKRALLPRCNVPADVSDADVKTITRMAGLEFKMGDPEMGRTLFEGILETQPKRLDLLSVYVDLEIKAGNYASARSLFKRALDRKLTTSVFTVSIGWVSDGSCRESQVALQEVPQIRRGARHGDDPGRGQGSGCGLCGRPADCGRGRRGGGMSGRAAFCANDDSASFLSRVGNESASGAAAVTLNSNSSTAANC